MNKQELDEALNEVIEGEGEIEIVVYAILKDEDDPKKLNIKAENLSEISELFVNAIKSYVIDKEDHSVLLLSTADERGKCFYEYDLELPAELEYLESVIGNDGLNTFNFNDDELEEIDSLIVVLARGEHEVSLYKRISPIEVLGRGGYILGKSATRFERFEDQLLRISPRFQVLKVREDIIVIDLPAIEKSFGFHEVITREALVSLRAIEALQIVSNIETLQELVDDVSFARKLTRVARNSPVLQMRIPNNQIISFSKSHPATRNRIKLTEDETQFSLTTKVSKNLFIKLLNDDYLTSELTQLYYDSLAKDGVEIEENDEQENEEVAQAVVEAQ